MNKEEAMKIVSDWNGKDDKFMSDGEVYTEEDVQEAQAVLDKEGEHGNNDNIKRR